MIRDPSDGTVREKSDGSDLSHPPMTGEIPAMTSGLAPTTAKSDYLARLEMSREWLKNYRTANSEAQ